MTYIVNPAWLYWVEISGTVKIFLVVLGVFGMIFTTVYACLGYGNADTDEEGRQLVKKELKVFSAFLLVLVISFFIPSSDTLTKMLIAKSVTAETVNAGVDAVKSTVDYIFQKFAELK